jgi:thymidine phosphorylase
MAVEAREPGTVTAIDVRRVGLAIVSLGGGRTRTDQAIDPAVGLSAVAGLGDRVGPGERVLALVHARDEADGARAAEAIRAAFTIEPQAEFHPKPPIAARLAPDRIGP